MSSLAVIKNDPLPVAKYEAMCTAIAACHSVDELKDYHDKARALEVYAAQAQNVEAERKATEIRLRAEAASKARHADALEAETEALIARGILRSAA